VAADRTTIDVVMSGASQRRAEQDIQVARCNVMLASITYRDRCVFGEAPMNIVSARTTPKRLISSDRLSPEFLDAQSSADTCQLDRCCLPDNVIR
jgi:hypothetical protein